MKTMRAADGTVRKVAGDLVLPRRLRRTLLVVVFADECVLWKGNEGGVDDDLDVGEEDRRRGVWGKRLDEDIVDGVAENAHDAPQHVVPVVRAVTVEAS